MENEESFKAEITKEIIIALVAKMDIADKDMSALAKKAGAMYKEIYKSVSEAETAAYD